MLQTPAVLSDRSGRSLALEILRYEFPDNLNDKYDANWLIVRMTAADGQERWTASDPALLTWELAWLITWLRNLADGGATADRLDFIEPCLAFEVDGSGDAAQLTASLGYAFRSPGTPDFEETRLTMCPGAATLRGCADALAAALARFPLRDVATE